MLNSLLTLPYLQFSKSLSFKNVFLLWNPLHEYGLFIEIGVEFFPIFPFSGIFIAPAWCEVDH